MFRRLFHLYPGEEKKAFLFAALGFLWAFSVTCGLKFADALFLIHIGSESLPTAYFLAASGNILIAFFMLYGFHVVSPARLFLIVIGIGIGFYALAYLFLAYEIGQDIQWLWFALKVFGWLFFTVVVTCFWTFIDQYYHLQDAKRLYSLFSSSVFIGLATTGVIMRLGILGPKHLALGICLLLFVTFFWIRFISKKVQVVPDDCESEGGIVESVQSLRGILRSVLSSPFAILLMTGNFMIQVLSVITEYNYLSDFDQRFDVQHSLMPGGEKDAALTLFLGQWVAVVSVCNLIFGLFIYSRLVRHFGINNLVMCTPIALLVIFSGWLTDNSLLFPVLGFFVVEGMLYVIDDCNFTLLLNAVPTKLKYKIRIFIESFFEPVGMLFSALFISFIQVDSRWIGLTLSFLALIVALGVRSRYFQGVYRNLTENAIHFDRSLQEWWNSFSKKERRGAEFRLLAILKQGNEMSQILACEGLIAFNDPIILHKLLQLSDYLSITAKIKFVNLMVQSSFHLDNRVLDKFHEWVYSEQDRQLTSTVHFYFARYGLLHPEKAMVDLNSNDLTLKGAAVLSLRKSWAHQLPTTVATNRTVAAKQLEEFLASKDEAEICMGLIILGAESSLLDFELMLPFLKHSSIQVARAAAVSVSESINRQGARYAPLLISQIIASSDNEYRLSCLKALGKIGDPALVKEMIHASVHLRPNERRLMEAIIAKMGLRTVPMLLSMTKDTTMHDRCRVLSGRTLGRLALPQLRANLYEIIHGEIERAYFYFYHHQIIQEKYPDLNLRILQDALLTGYHSVIDFIIQLLGVAGSIEDCELLSSSLRSRNPKVRSQVVETLERTCDTKIFRLLQPLVSDLPIEEKIRAYKRGGRTALSLTELLDKLDQSPSLADQIMSASLQYRLNIPHWRESIRQQMPANEEIFHHFAYELLES